jgi:hypothetical protein
MELPAWARAVIPGPGTSPLLYAGTLAGRPAAVMAFEPRRSDLPLQVAFPVLLANLAGELLGGSDTPADAVAPGSPVTLQIPAGAKGVRVERPDGTADELLAPTAESASVTFARTDLLGVYTVTPIANPDATPTSDATATPSATAAPSPTPGGSGAAGVSPGASPTFRPADPNAPVRFAVDLLDVGESRIAPGDPAVLQALGKAAAQPGTGVATARPSARDEIWIPIVLVALLVLTLEWLVYERDTLLRLRRGIVARVRGTRPAGGGA